MATFGKASLDKLKTVHPDLQKICIEAIKHYDFQVIYGQRTAAEQFELYKQGRKLVNGVWTKVGPTVTNLDGITKKSNHNYSPSKAVDLAPYPIDWNNIQRFKDLAKVMKAAADKLGIKMVWGGDWKKFIDYPHYELPK